MADEKHIQYFLGANSPSGFYSLYDHLLPPERASRFYILKGGPGCGKSTLMRQVARQAEEAGEEVEYILCSGDPDSLDAILLPRLGVATRGRHRSPCGRAQRTPARWKSTSTWAGPIREKDCRR